MGDRLLKPSYPPLPHPHPPRSENDNSRSFVGELERLPRCHIRHTGLFLLERRARPARQASESTPAPASMLKRQLPHAPG